MVTTTSGTSCWRGRWAERHGLDPQSILGELASYAILDGLIANTDRHHENWMFFYHLERRSYQLAPSYDHGSSLGRELQDVSRRVSRSRLDILASGRVLNYLLGGAAHVLYTLDRTVRRRRRRW